MEGAKKKLTDDQVSANIQRKFDLVFESSAPAARSRGSESAAMDSDPSELQFGSGGDSMSESAKKESTPSIDLDFGEDSSLDFSSESPADTQAAAKKEPTGKLSIVPDDSGLEFNLDFGDDAEIPAVPAQPAAAPAKASEETKSDSHFELDLSGGDEALDDEHVIETAAASASAAVAALPDEGMSLDMDAIFDAEIESAASKVQVKESTQPTIVYDNSASGIQLDSFRAGHDSTGTGASSSDLMTTEEAKANIESTIKDILRPKPSADSTQEIDIGGLNDSTGESVVPEMDFSADVKAEPTGEFDLSGMEFADKDEEEESLAAPAPKATTPKVAASVEPEVAVKAVDAFAHEPAKSFERVDRTHTSFVSDEDSARIQGTIRQMREERDSLLNEIKMLKGQMREVEQDNLTLKAALDEAKIENSIIRKRHLAEMEELKYRVSIAEEKRVLAEEKARNAEARREKLEQRVRIDFNQVKQREKELETKLEMLSMDIDSQVHSRDQKILELRRKIDALEFNMENVSIREQKSQDDKRKLEEKLNKIMKTLRHSIKNLEDDIDQVTEEAESDTDERIKTGQR